MDSENIPPVTEALAMDYGWVWKIPLQDRYGCGYVFDESLISEEEARKEVEKELGREIEPLKTLRFKPGYYKEPWKYNVISIGLSSGFIEPLEATSIWTTISYARQVLASTELMYSRDKRISEEFNRSMTNINEEVSAFVNFHYMGQRDDTEFWRKFSKENCVPSLKRYLDILEYRSLRTKDIDASKVWDIYSWYFVGDGIDYPLFKEMVERHYFYNNFRNHIKTNFLGYKSQTSLMYRFTGHKEMIENLKNGST
jgi:tryptophan halogenase